MDLQGLCLVDDPQAATQALLEGIGRQKAFGMGLLMVKPA